MEQVLEGIKFESLYDSFCDKSLLDLYNLKHVGSLSFEEATKNI
jgi:hypothetical protein